MRRLSWAQDEPMGSWVGSGTCTSMGRVRVGFGVVRAWRRVAILGATRLGAGLAWDDHRVNPRSGCRRIRESWVGQAGLAQCQRLGYRSCWSGRARERASWAQRRKTKTGWAKIRFLNFLFFQDFNSNGFRSNSN
jgi:hypothetical protein